MKSRGFSWRHRFIFQSKAFNEGQYCTGNLENKDSEDTTQVVYGLGGQAVVR